MKCFVFIGFLFTAVLSLATENHDVPNSRIVGRNEKKVGLAGGQNITISQASYIGTVIDRYYPAGSVVILNKHWVLTAARNVINADVSTTKIRVGSTFSEKEGQLVDVKRFLIRKEYNGGWNDNIALINLASPLTFNENVSAISLSSVLPHNRNYAVVSGFGYDVSPYSIGFLKLASVMFLNYNACKQHYEGLSDFTSNNFCTYMKDTGPCAYDWGSPLVYNTKLIGIYSGSFQCGGTDFPPVYVDITKYRTWIINKIRKYLKPTEELDFD